LGKFLDELRSSKQLKQTTYETTPTFSLNGKKCKGKILKIYDGDTIWIALPVLDQIYKYKARLYGYDSPEIRPLENLPNRNEVIANAEKAKKRLEELTACQDLVDVELLDFDKYGRILIKIYNNKVCVNDQMIREGFGKPYFGGKKE
jgi:endonuclease YncB( thermonuclease family)